MKRSRDKKAAHLGGERGPDVSFETLTVDSPATVAGRRVLIVDDMSKTGAEIEAVRRHMLEAGTSHVEALAIGCTGGATIVERD